MFKRLYCRLAFNNLKNNRKFYLPYLFACIGTVMMFSIIVTLMHDPSLDKNLSVRGMLGFGSIVIGIFSVVILFYTNSMLTKRRKKEFGLYNILGMEKRHIGYVLFWETLYTAVISLLCGLLLGVLFSKLMLLILGWILNCKIGFTLQVSSAAFGLTTVLFVAVFALIFLNTLRIICLSNPIQLLHGSGTPEREPKSKWIIAILGVLLLGGGYALALMVKTAMDAIGLFFLAVLLVIAGTYFSFIAFSIVLLKLLRKNKHYYYQTRHFATIAGMLYRMKHNAAGLASICILSTMVLVTMSTTVCLYANVDSMIQDQFPSDIALEYRDATTPEYRAQVVQTTKSTAEKMGRAMKEIKEYQSLSFAAVREGNDLVIAPDMNNFSAMYTNHQAVSVFITDAAGYCSLLGQDVTVPEGEMLCYSDGEPLGTKITLQSQTYRLKALDSFPIRSGYDYFGIKTVYLVTDSIKTLESLADWEQSIYKDNGSALEYCYRFDTDGSDDDQYAFAETLNQLIKEPGKTESSYLGKIVSCQVDGRRNYVSMYGSFLFLGLFLGLIFAMATVLIMYYKQVSEGYDDRERFVIMQKVGMTPKEVRSTIRSQVLVVFFLPLVTAGIHILFAFPMIRKILACFGMVNTSSFIVCTVSTLAVFTLLYTLVYCLTAKMYYHIVGGKANA